MRAPLRLSVLLAVSAATSSCVMNDVYLDQRHVDVQASQKLLGTLECRLAEFDLVDARAYKGLGWIGGHELLYPELETWIGDSLRQSTQPDPEAAPLVLEISRAYIESHPSGNSFQLVMRVRGQSAESGEWRVYRGSDSGVTWWGNAGEFGEYLERAGSSALTALIKGEGVCSRGGSSKTSGALRAS
jgi:hypothetical protein